MREVPLLSHVIGVICLETTGHLDMNECTLHAGNEFLPHMLDPTVPNLQILTAAWRNLLKVVVKGLSNIGFALKERIQVVQESLNRLKTRFPTFRKLATVPRQMGTVHSTPLIRACFFFWANKLLGVCILSDDQRALVGFCICGWHQHKKNRAGTRNVA